jgi:predicted nucleic acid-binding protein
MNRELSTLAFEQFRALPLQQFMSSGIHGRALDLTRSLNLGRAYDAHYVALAELLDAELITADSKLANAFARTYSRIQLLGSSSN